MARSVPAPSGEEIIDVMLLRKAIGVLGWRCRSCCGSADWRPGWRCSRRSAGTTTHRCTTRSRGCCARSGWGCSLTARTCTRRRRSGERTGQRTWPLCSQLERRSSRPRPAAVFRRAWLGGPHHAGASATRSVSTTESSSSRKWCTRSHRSWGRSSTRNWSPYCESGTKARSTGGRLSRV